MKEWTTPDSRNTPSTTNPEEEKIVDALGNDGNASMPEQVKRPNPWTNNNNNNNNNNMMMMMMMKTTAFLYLDKATCLGHERLSSGDQYNTILQYKCSVKMLSCLLYNVITQVQCVDVIVQIYITLYQSNITNLIIISEIFWATLRDG